MASPEGSSTLNLRIKKKYKATWANAASVTVARAKVTTRRISVIMEAAVLIDKFGSTSSYREDGDRSLDTGKQLKIRQRLSEHPEIKKMIRRFWDVLVDGQEARGASIDKVTYVSFFLSVSRALLERDVFDLEECTSAVLMDWKRDTESQEKPLDQRSIGRSQFHACFFETVDVWTLTTEADEYVSFLKNLFPRVITVDDGNNKRASLLAVVHDGSTEDEDDSMVPLSIGQQSLSVQAPLSIGQ